LHGVVSTRQQMKNGRDASPIAAYGSWCLRNTHLTNVSHTSQQPHDKMHERIDQATHQNEIAEARTFSSDTSCWLGAQTPKPDKDRHKEDN
jgi:hypothetical protein